MLAMPRRTSRGSSVVQRGTASGQRGWKAHPVGRSARLGGWPAIESRASLLPSLGTEPSKARVYGCPGWSNSSRTGACSMILPAYMTATLSHIFVTHNLGIEDQGHAGLALDVLEKIEVLGLDGDV